MAPGLVVIQEIFGVDPHIRAVCDHYAEEGYNAIRPDIFWWLKPGVELACDDAGIHEGRELVAKCDIELAVRDLATAVEYLRMMPSGSGKAGVAGFCFASGWHSQVLRGRIQM